MNGMKAQITLHVYFICICDNDSIAGLEKQ